MLANHNKLPSPYSPLCPQGSAFRAVGAPTEAALLVLAEKVGLADAAATAAARKKRTNTPEEHPQPVTNVSGLRPRRTGSCCSHELVSHDASCAANLPAQLGTPKR